MNTCSFTFNVIFHLKTHTVARNNNSFMWKVQNKNWMNDIKLPFWRFLQRTFNWSEKILKSSLIHHGILHLSHGTLIWLDWRNFGCEQVSIKNVSNFNSLDPKGYLLEWDQNILELYFHIHGQLKQMNGEHGNTRGFFFCIVFVLSNFLIFGDFFPKF